MIRPGRQLSRQWTRERASRLGVLLLALFGVAQVLSLVHLVVVPHAACPVHEDMVHEGAAHGDLVHGDLVRGGNEHGLHAQGESESCATSSGPSWTAPSSGGSEHPAHCGIALLLRSLPPALSGQEPGPRSTESCVRTETPVLSSAREHGFPLYLLAPKTSPPEFG